MASAMAIVLYPPPTDTAAFEQVYQQEHIALVQRIPHLTRFVQFQILGSPGGPAPYHRGAELHFASLEMLQAALGTPEAQAAVGHAMQISSGGPPVILLAHQPD
jgi:uncharacterized protein (TIGR02118 family)